MCSARPGSNKIEADRLTKKVFFNFSRYLVDFFYSRELSQDFIERHVKIHGLEKLDRERAKGRGVILVSGHIGHWEMGGMTLAKLGYPVYCVAATHRDSRINRLFLENRKRHGLETIPLGCSLKQAYRILKENKILGLNADRLFGGEGVPVQFLGRQTLFPKGAARIARATRASLVPIFFIAEAGDRYRLEVCDPIPVIDERVMTQDFANILGKKIGEHPTQWFIFQPFWETARLPI